MRDTHDSSVATRPRFKRLPTPATPEKLSTPYKGLVPFTEADAPFFFGRDSERKIIAANLRSSRLTILYGESGTGKSSVLRAGVIPDLRRSLSENLETRGEPRFAVVAFNAWRDDPAAGLARAIGEALDELVESRESSGDASLSDLFQGAAEQINGKILVILDQFEEYFLYHRGEGDEGPFPSAFIEAVNRDDLRVNFLISIREDALAKLDVFQGEIPHLFDNYLRIDHLDVVAARSAIVEPVARYNELAASSARHVPGTVDETDVVVEPDLVEAVVAELETGRVLVGEVGHSETPESGSGAARIQTPYLQLVMTRLWAEEQRAGSRVLRRATLDSLGGAERIVATHLDEAMSVLSPGDRHLAANIFHYLVTPTGTKIAHAPIDLAAYVASSEETIRRVLQRLSESDVRILRPVPRPLGQEGESRFEIFHDVLAGVILDWRARYLKDRELSDAVRWGIATVVHGLAGFWWLLITFGVVLIAIDEDPKNWFFLFWTLPATAVWLGATPVLRRRWRERKRMLPAVLLAELAAFTAPLSLLVIVPVALVRRRRRRRRAAEKKAQTA
jgi:hypothetical protein